jgi:hypothetical protein
MNVYHYMKKIACSVMALISAVAFVCCAQCRAVLGSSDQPIAPVANYRDALKPDLQFLGKVSAPVKAGWESEHSDARLESESLVYGQAESGGTIEKLLVIRTYQVRGESSMVLPELDLDRQPVLDSGTVSVSSTQFAYTLLPGQGSIGQDERELIGSKGYSMAGCYLLKAYSGRLKTGLFAKTVSHILYFEGTGAGSTGAACTQFIQSQDNKRLVNGFSAAADGYVGTLISTAEKGKSVSKETTDEMVLPEMPARRASELERKLTTLKGLLDKGMITQEDYNKKKEKLLEDF